MALSDQGSPTVFFDRTIEVRDIYSEILIRARTFLIVRAAPGHEARGVDQNSH